MLAGPLGFEPKFADPKSAVLPLDEGPAVVGSRALKKMERETGFEPATFTLAR
jgi:hypothetical protein